MIQKKRIEKEFSPQECDLIFELLEKAKNDEPELLSRVEKLMWRSEAAEKTQELKKELKADWEREKKWMVQLVRKALNQENVSWTVLFLVSHFDSMIAAKLLSSEKKENILISPFIYTMQ